MNTLHGKVMGAKREKVYKSIPLKAAQSQRDKSCGRIHARKKRQMTELCAASVMNIWGITKFTLCFYGLLMAGKQSVRGCWLLCETRRSKQGPLLLFHPTGNTSILGGLFSWPPAEKRGRESLLLLLPSSHLSRAYIRRVHGNKGLYTVLKRREKENFFSLPIDYSSTDRCSWVILNIILWLGFDQPGYTMWVLHIILVCHCFYNVRKVLDCMDPDKLLDFLEHI